MKAADRAYSKSSQQALQEAGQGDPTATTRTMPDRHSTPLSQSIVSYDGRVHGHDGEGRGTPQTRAQLGRRIRWDDRDLLMEKIETED